MEIPLYLAMTAAEYSGCTELPAHMGWMACHFSPSGPGLSNMPPYLPTGSVLLVDDSNPFCDHQARIIARQLAEAVEKWHLCSVVLDFQRPVDPDVKKMAEHLHSALPCPVVVTPDYAPSASPILLPPCPPNRRLQDHIAPFKGRDIWLELALEGMSIHISRAGSHAEPLPYTSAAEFPHWDERLHCHYRIIRATDSVTFHLQRSREDLQKLLANADGLGITHAIGLWQEFA
ncbi:MAG: hypothetical protein E7447_05840 [Ruminococcaceae bacterium]|nr:hypothetical protein [Oscillospiraceae bacterium]